MHRMFKARSGVCGVIPIDLLMMEGIFRVWSYSVHRGRIELTAVTPRSGRRGVYKSVLTLHSKLIID